MTPRACRSADAPPPRRAAWIVPVVALLAGCAGNLGAGAPLGGALASCSTEADPARMVPADAVTPPRGGAYRIGAVRVTGPVKGSVPQPIKAAAFAWALEHALGEAGLLGRQGEEACGLAAHIVSQTHQGGLWATSLELTVDYVLTCGPGAGDFARRATIVSRGTLDDWRADACARLRRLQEDLSRDSLRRLLALLAAGQPGD